jgi:hypothetical protein
MKLDFFAARIRRAAFLLVLPYVEELLLLDTCVPLEVDVWVQERNADLIVLPARVAVTFAKPGMRCQTHKCSCLTNPDPESASEPVVVRAHRLHVQSEVASKGFDS